MSHTVDNILVVQSDDRLTQFLDLDNVLCLQDRTVLGRVLLVLILTLSR